MFSKHSFYRCLISVLIVALCPFAMASGNGAYNVDSILSVLDATITRRPQIIERKEQRLNDLRCDYQKALSPEQRYSLSNNLFSEYEYYQSDSALHYAKLAESVAHELGNKSLVNESLIRRASCLVTAGMFYEAINILSFVEVPVLNVQQKIYYHQIRSSVDFGLRGAPENIQLLKEYYLDEVCESLDSICALTSNESLLHKEARLKKLFITGTNGVSPRDFVSLVNDFDLDKRHASDCYSYAARLDNTQSHTDAAIFHFAQSAIWDIETCTSFNYSLQYLARLLLLKDKTEQAWHYVTLAQTDADNFNSFERHVQTNRLSSLISQTLCEKLNKDRTIVVCSSAGGLLILTLLILIVVQARLKNRQLKLLSEELRVSLEKQTQYGQQLAELNSQLSDAEEIKNRYIFESLCGTPDFTNEVERACVTAEKRLIAKQYSEAMASLNSIDIKRERDRQLSAFDTALLRLFPTFLVEYNNLFPADGQVRINANGTLPSEVRIFALMRLGITDTERVSLYLNISTNSLYVYKAKARARALVEKNEFDKKIMNIGRVAS